MRPQVIERSGSVLTGIIRILEIIVGCVLWVIIAAALATRWAYKSLNYWRRYEHVTLRADAAIAGIKQRGGSDPDETERKEAWE